MAPEEKIWLKRANIPIWVIQLIVLLIFTASAGIALYAVENIDNLNGNISLGDNVEQVLNTAAAIQLAFSLFTIIMIIVEIILSASHRLGPVANIVIQCIKSAIWTFFFAISIRAAIIGSESGWSIFLILVLFLTCMAQLIYGSVIVHRHRKGTLYRGNYSLTAGGQAQNTSYQPNFQSAPVGSYALQAHQPNPFQDPSPAPPGYTAQYPHSAETAYRPQGTVGEYYGGGTANTFEMHGNSTRY